MTLKYLSVIAVVLFCVFLRTNASNFADRCEFDGDVLCENCENIGSCRDLGDGTYTVDFQFTCPSGEVCSEDFEADGSADCYRISAAISPECMCQDESVCQPDPFDSSSYVNCGSDATRSYVTCDGDDVFDQSTCGCIFPCPPCGYYSANDGTCANYFSCITGNTLSGRCPSGFCFNAATCGCSEEVAECPACGYTADPSDPEGFFYCNNAPETPGKCPNGYEFHQSSCSCALPGSITTTSAPVPTTTTAAPLCGACGYAPYPGDVCEKYYHCLPDGTVSIEDCPSTLCYDDVTCACDIPALEFFKNHYIH